MNRELWTSWATDQGEQFLNQPWLLSKWDTVCGVVWPAEKIRLMIDDIRAKLELHRDHALLDIGTGPGWICRRLKPYTKAAVGLDFAPSMISFAAKTTNLALVQADAEFLPFSDSSFQRILIYFTLMNFTDRGKIFAVLREALRVLDGRGEILAGQMPLKSRSGDYDQEKQRYLQHCRAHFQLGEDTARRAAPPIVLFEDDFERELAAELGVKVSVHQSFNHFWREGEPVQCSWRVDYLLAKD